MLIENLNQILARLCTKEPDVLLQPETMSLRLKPGALRAIADNGESESIACGGKYVECLQEDIRALVGYQSTDKNEFARALDFSQKAK